MFGRTKIAVFQIRNKGTATIALGDEGRSAIDEDFNFFFPLRDDGTPSKRISSNEAVS